MYYAELVQNAVTIGIIVAFIYCKRRHTQRDRAHKAQLDKLQKDFYEFVKR